MRNIIFFLTVAALLVAVNLNATQIDGLRTSVSGADMAGMLVTTSFAGPGPDETITWTATSPKAGEAAGTGWCLRFDGSDTWFSNPHDDGLGGDRAAYWEFTNTGSAPITAFTIDAIAGGIFFDIFANYDYWGVPTGNDDTPGSRDGWWQGNSYTETNTSETYTDPDPSKPSFEWEFTDLISVGAAPAVGDLFGNLTITFLDPLETGEMLQFGVDTDAVPEPSTMILLGLGMVGLAGINRRRRK